MKKNKYSTPLWMLATILAGMLSPMQSAVNGQLGHWLQDGNACAVISFASGLVVMFFIIMARKETRQQFAAIPSLIKNRKVPLWNWFRCRREKILYPLSHHRCIICGYCYDFCCVTSVAFYLFHLTCHSSVLSWFACRMAALWKCKSS